MTTRELVSEDKSLYNKLCQHPLQSWEWGEFRRKLGVEVVRVGFFSGTKLKNAFQLTFHKVPWSNYTVGYFPKGLLPNAEVIAVLKEIGNKHNSIFIQLEPNVIQDSGFRIQDSGLKPSAHPLFTKYTFHIDLTKSEAELLKNMHPKTRYNIRLAQKHGVTVQEENTDEAFTRYLTLTQETTRRQGFYAHDSAYHRLMWKTLSSSGIAHLLTARYQGRIVVAWIVFLYKEVLYYPYGASTQEYKEVMASNLMMWEAMRWGKQHGVRTLDLWGTPGRDPKPTDPYYGFHKFKLGYGPELVEFIGSYDLVLKQLHYKIFTVVDKLRWFILKLKTKFVK